MSDWDQNPFHPKAAAAASDTGGYDIKSPVATNYLLQAIIEAVRALKPESATFKDMSLNTVKALANAELEVARYQHERHAWIHELSKMETERNEARAEVERLRAENADIAKAEKLEREERAKMFAELKRFREREEKVLELVRLSKSDHFDDDCEECLALDAAAAAVRDFKVPICCGHAHSVDPCSHVTVTDSRADPPEEAGSHRVGQGSSFAVREGSR